MLRYQFLCHVLKALLFIKIALKLSYYCKKMQNFRALGALPQTPTGLRRLGAPPPHSQNSPPFPNFWLRAWWIQILNFSKFSQCQQLWTILIHLILEYSNQTLSVDAVRLPHLLDYFTRQGFTAFIEWVIYDFANFYGQSTKEKQIWTK